MTSLPVMGWHCEEGASRCGRKDRTWGTWLSDPPPGGSDVAGKLKGWPSWSGGCKLHWAYSMESLDARVVIRPSQLLISSPIFERGLMLMKVEERQ